MLALLSPSRTNEESRKKEKASPDPHGIAPKAYVAWRRTYEGHPLRSSSILRPLSSAEQAVVRRGEREGMNVVHTCSLAREEGRGRGEGDPTPPSLQHRYPSSSAEDSASS